MHHHIFLFKVPLLLTAEEATLLQLTLQDEKVGQGELVHELARRAELVLSRNHPPSPSPTAGMWQGYGTIVCNKGKAQGYEAKCMQIG